MCTMTIHPSMPSSVQGSSVCSGGTSQQGSNGLCGRQSACSGRGASYNSSSPGSFASSRLPQMPCGMGSCYMSIFLLAASSVTTNSACSCPGAAAKLLTPQQKPLMLSAGITKTSHLQGSLGLHQPQLLALDLLGSAVYPARALRQLPRCLFPRGHLPDHTCYSHCLTRWHTCVMT